MSHPSPVDVAFMYASELGGRIRGYSIIGKSSVELVDRLRSLGLTEVIPEDKVTKLVLFMNDFSTFPEDATSNDYVYICLNVLDSRVNIDHDGACMWLFLNRLIPDVTAVDYLQCRGRIFLYGDIILDSIFAHISALGGNFKPILRHRKHMFSGRHTSSRKYLPVITSYVQRGCGTENDGWLALGLCNRSRGHGMAAGSDTFVISKN